MRMRRGWIWLGGLLSLALLAGIAGPYLVEALEAPAVKAAEAPADTAAKPETETTAAVATEEEEKPYKIIDGKVDWATYNGFRRFNSECHVCHGPDGAGSSFAPALVESLKTLTYEDFIETVVNGRTRVVAGTPSVMPAFGTNPNVMPYLDDMYAYLKARSDGVLGRGRPPHVPKKKLEF